jgi:hypothetical protein
MSKAVVEAAPEAMAWTRELQDFTTRRLALVQTAAQSWLAVMTTLLGLVSVVAVLNHGTAISELPIGLLGRAAVFAVAVVVYLLAFIAVVYGALATFGGLGLPKPQDAPSPAAAGSRRAQPRQQAPLHAKLHEWWTPIPDAGRPEPGWEEYKRSRVRQADEFCRYLHRSRILGVLAALGVGVLAIVVLGIGAFHHPQQAGPSVVVVHDGQVTCGSISLGADGQTRIGGRVIAKATQVAVVAHC